MQKQPKQDIHGNTKSSEDKISPKEYRRILNSIDLAEIFVTHCSAKFNKDRLNGVLKIDAKFSNEYFTIKEDKKIEITTKCRITAYKERKSYYTIIIEAYYVMLIYIENKEDFSSEFFDIYKQINLPVNIWPYFREFVQNMTQRMNIPPLTLPFYKT